MSDKIKVKAVGLNSCTITQYPPTEDSFARYREPTATVSYINAFPRQLAEFLDREDTAADIDTVIDAIVNGNLLAWKISDIRIAVIAALKKGAGK